MKLKEYHPLEEMERIPEDEISRNVDQIFERIDNENIGFVITRDGKDSCVLCPYEWFEPEYETIEVEVDSLLLEQVKAIIAPMGWTVEGLFTRFIEWVVDPDTQEEAIAWLKKAKEETELQ